MQTGRQIRGKLLHEVVSTCDLVFFKVDSHQDLDRKSEQPTGNDL